MKWNYWIALYVRTHCTARGLALLQHRGLRHGASDNSELTGPVPAHYRPPDRIAVRDVLEYVQHLREHALNGTSAVNRHVVDPEKFLLRDRRDGPSGALGQSNGGFPDDQAVPKKRPGRAVHR